MRYVQLAARTVALAILLVGFAAAAAAAMPQHAEYDDFLLALDRGAVESVVVDDDSGHSTTVSDSGPTVWRVAWSTGPFVWRSGLVAERPIPKSQFMNDMGRRGVDVTTDADDDSLISRLFQLSSWLGGLVGTTWIVTFIVMLASRPHWGNRWAWFWMFTVGQIGALLFLIAEPTPLWKEKSVNAEFSADTRVAGGQGCMLSIALAMASAMLAVGVSWLLNRVFG